MKRTAKIVCAVMTAIIAVTGGALASMRLFGEFAGIEKEKLTGYKYSRSGDMQGSSYSESVQEYSEDSALFTIMQREWHRDDGTVKEYLVDKEILNELKAVFVKYHMEKWDNKKFTDRFIADGASDSYRFEFETNHVSFSSQYYPEKYSSKLKELDEILNKHLENATLLPGLLIHDSIKESDYTLPYDLNNGKIVLSVYSYHQKYLYYRLANGTDEEKKIESVIRLYRDGESVPIYEKSSEHKISLSAHRLYENSVKLNKLLAPGKYRFEAFGYETEFEIQLKKTVCGNENQYWFIAKQ